MAAPGPSNHIAKRVVDDLVDFSGDTFIPKVMKLSFGQQIKDMRGFVTLIRKEAHTSRNCIAQLTALVAKIEAIDDEEDMFDTLIYLRDDTQDENNKLMELNSVSIFFHLEFVLLHGDALKSLEYMREMVVHDSATLGVLEQLFASTHVRMRLNASYMNDMDEAE
uniref:Uncharacterized protein n=1 Tax=Tanacetum cinerariifolium TaxID=118510 RepID=A0A699GSE6_TANCI|nr:hypothetical protein [Tanacetum cinerariifolium]